MNGFKLIAICPLKNCNKKISKVLVEDVIYSFYEKYDFTNYKKEGLVLIKQDLLPDLYSIINNYKKEVKINVSAIVGENGSGKSSLVELLYAFCYNISAIRGILFDENEQRRLNEKDTIPNINVEIFYEADNKLYLLRLDKGVVVPFLLNNSRFEELKDNVDYLDNFFYTIAINYSLHSLNSTVLGSWLKKIFHKNDGYQTPIVLNPYRDKGNIDINNEEYLIRSRLISNILGKTSKKLRAEETLKNVINNKVAYKLKIQINKEKFEYDDKKKPIFKLTDEFGIKILKLVYKYFLSDENFVPKDTLLNKYAKEYIIYKLKSIALKYQPYKSKYYNFLTYIDASDEYIARLSKDNSHITFKLKQAVNFLINDIYYKRKERFDLTISYLSNELDKRKDLYNKQLIDILPPSFFKIDIEFKNASTFNLLSSGEKQRIYSITTLMYHLNNLSSIQKDISTRKYNKINVIFDELELYFHPELQRNLINDIIENLKRVDLKNIEGINILLITHSPFILSDIPDSNVLLMTQTGLPQPNGEYINTFAGNIHELLANSFFLNNGLIGEFAKNRIQAIIDYLNSTENLRTKNPSHQLVLKEIQIVGEPFLKEKLLEMYYNKFEKQKRIEELKDELKRLEEND